jgi:hypothetical protein
MFGRKGRDDASSEAQEANKTEVHDAEQSLEQGKKSFWTAILPVMACGAGLFSDGYINNVGCPNFELGDTAKSRPTGLI